MASFICLPCVGALLLDPERRGRADEHERGDEDPAVLEGVAGVQGGSTAEDGYEAGDSEGVAGLARRVDHCAARGGIRRGEISGGGADEGGHGDADPDADDDPPREDVGGVVLSALGREEQ